MYTKLVSIGLEDRLYDHNQRKSPEGRLLGGLRLRRGRRSIAADPKHLGARIGVLSILHTWDSRFRALALFGRRPHERVESTSCRRPKPLSTQIRCSTPPRAAAPMNRQVNQ